MEASLADESLLEGSLLEDSEFDDSGLEAFVLAGSCGNAVRQSTEVRTDKRPMRNISSAIIAQPARLWGGRFWPKTRVSRGDILGKRRPPESAPPLDFAGAARPRN